MCISYQRNTAIKQEKFLEDCLAYSKRNPSPRAIVQVGLRRAVCLHRDGLQDGQGEALSRLLPTTACSGLLRHVTEKQRSSAAQASRRRWVPVRSRKQGPDGSPEHGPLATLEAGVFEGPEAIRLKFTPHLCARDRLPMDKSVLTSLSEDTARHVRRDRVTKFWPVECGLDPRNCPHNHLSLSAGLTSGVRQGPGG